MQEVSEERNAAIARIAALVDKLFSSNNLYPEKLDKDEVIKLLVSLLSKFSGEDLRAISDEDLRERIDGVLIIEAVAGTLNDLTPEQIEMFDAAVEGR